MFLGEFEGEKQAMILREPVVMESSIPTISQPAERALMALWRKLLNTNIATLPPEKERLFLYKAKFRKSFEEGLRRVSVT